MVVHLKRLDWTLECTDGVSAFTARKLHCEVQMPQEGLDFGALCTAEAPQKEPQIYDLIATVDHHGTSAEVGHYTSKCLRPDGWYCFDDSVVTHLGNNSRIVGPENYLLMLQRRGTQGDTTITLAEQSPSIPMAWPHVLDVDWSFLQGFESQES